MKITLTSLIVLSSVLAHAQNSTSADNAADPIAITYVSDIMTPATPNADASAPAAAKPDYELTCRAQAKEIAANAYRSCITDSRSAQIDQLKKDYQEEIKALKAKYEAEIKALASANATEKAAAAESAAGTDKNAAIDAAASETGIAPKAAKTNKAKKAEVKPAANKAAVAKKSAPAIAGTAAKKNSKEATPAAAKAKKAVVKSAAQSQANKISDAAVKPEAAKAAAIEDIKEMNIELKPAAKTAGSDIDESTMDLPEPIPVETN